MASAGASSKQTGHLPRAGDLGPAVRRTLSDRLPRPWLFPLLVFAATWLVILASWYGSDAIYGHRHAWTWHFLIKDAGFYLKIAEHGYPGDPAKAAFFPLFPLLIHLASYLTAGNYPIAGLLPALPAVRRRQPGSGRWRPGCVTGGSPTVPCCSIAPSRAR